MIETKGKLIHLPNVVNAVVSPGFGTASVAASGLGLVGMEPSKHFSSPPSAAGPSHTASEQHRFF